MTDEVKVDRGYPFPDLGARSLPDEVVDQICPGPTTEPPPWLLAQAEVIAAATVEKMKPLMRIGTEIAVRTTAV